MTIYLSTTASGRKPAPVPSSLSGSGNSPPQHLIISCPPQVLEYCHSARSPEEYLELREDMNQLLAAWEYPDETVAVDIQQALWNNRLMPAATAFDCLIAAYAIANDAAVLNSDRDFGDIERATGGAVRQEYIAA